MFEFAAGKINVLEKKVFDKLDQERMLRSPDFEQAFEVLYDTDLGKTAVKTKNIEEILENDFAELKKDLCAIIEDPKIILFLFLRFDAANIKLALKKFQKKDIDAPYIPWASENPQRIEKLIPALMKGGPASNKINPRIRRLVRLSLNFLKNNSASSEIEAAVDSAYFKAKSDLARAIDPFLKELTEVEIDLLNLKNLLRPQESESKKSVFIDGGIFSRPELTRISKLKSLRFLENVEEFLESYRFSRLLNEYQKTKSLIELEKDSQNLLSDIIFQKSRQTSSGIEKVLSFFQRKLNVQHNVRLILFAKQNNISMEEMEGKLLLI